MTKEQYKAAAIVFERLANDLEMDARGYEMEGAEAEEPDDEYVDCPAAYETAARNLRGWSKAMRREAAEAERKAKL